MTRTEIITRLCEIAAELTDLAQNADSSDVKFHLTDIEQHIQKNLHELQESNN